jgi:hypothetical protein
MLAVFRLDGRMVHMPDEGPQTMSYRGIEVPVLKSSIPAPKNVAGYSATGTLVRTLAKWKRENETASEVNLELYLWL